MDPCLREHGHPVNGPFENWLEVIEVIRQLVELEVGGDVQPPGFRQRLERPEEHFARILLVVRTFIRHPQNR